MLYDQHGRLHNYLRISLTERCNLRCFYCMPDEDAATTPAATWMTAKEVVEIARIFVELGVTKIRLTGGEPLLRKDSPTILEGLAQLPVQLNITTNGVLVHRYLEVLRAAQVRAINVSLDTLDPDKFAVVTKRNQFQRVWDNILLLLEMDIRVKINVVLMRAINWTELVDFVALTQDLPIQVQFIEFMPFRGNDWDWSKGISEAEILEVLATHYGAERLVRLKDAPNDTANNYTIQGHQGSFAIISTITNPFCSTCNRIRLTANGCLKNCLFSNTETDLLTALRAGEDIHSIICKSIFYKHATRGGMQTFDELADPEQHGQNRSMIRIGG